MPNTTRYTNDLLGRFADNTTGAIAAQDGRDLIVSANIFCGEWVATEQFYPGNTVTRSGRLYFAVRGTTNVDPATDANVNWWWIGPVAGSGSPTPTPTPTPTPATGDEFGGTSLDAKWAYLNQGSMTAAVAGGALTLSTPSDAGEQVRGIMQPVGPWPVTAKCNGLSPTVNYAETGLFLYDSFGGTLVAFVVVNGGGAIYLQQHATPNSGATNLGDSGSGPGSAYPYYLRVGKVGTVYTFSTSPDGSTWTDRYTLDGSNYPNGFNRVGLMVENSGTGQTESADWDWFHVGS